MTLVGVLRQKLVAGFKGPTEGKTWDWRHPVGSAENTQGVAASAQVMELAAAFDRVWLTDAHFVPYVVSHGGEALQRQPRINKPGLVHLAGTGFEVHMTCLVADFDNPTDPRTGKKSVWTQDLLDEQLELCRCDAVRYGGWYFTLHGWHLVAPLRVPLLLEGRGEYAEAVLDAWYAELEAQGLRPDRKCIDATHLYSLPNIHRKDGEKQRSKAWLDGMQERDTPKPLGRVIVRASEKRRARVVGAVNFAATLPEEWSAKVPDLAAAVLQVQTEWHSLFLALAGALCEAGVALELVPALCAAVSVGTGADDRSADRVEGARTTARRYAAGEGVAGHERLALEWPGVAAALERALQTRPPQAELPSAAEAAELVYGILQSLPEGVTLLAVGCGVGKTQGGMRLALERAARGLTEKGRLKPGSKTVISVPTNELAKQVTNGLRARGGRVLRVFSPVSELGDDGKPVCVYAESAKHIAAASMSAPFELCAGRGKEPCPHRETCSVASGQEGPEDAPTVVGNHGLLGQLLGRAGTNVKLLDEPGAVLETFALVHTDLAAILERESVFEARYLDCLRPAVECFEAHLRVSDEDTGTLDAAKVLELRASAVGAASLNDALRAADAPSSERVGEDILLCAIGAWDDSRRGAAVRWQAMARARLQPEYAERSMQAARAAWVLHCALCAPGRTSVRVERRGGVKTLLFTAPRRELHEALRAPGATAVLDASPDVAGLSAAAGYDLEPRTHRVWARDGAPIARTHLQWAKGARKHLLPESGLDLAVLASGLRAALAWAAEDPGCRSLGLLTLLPVELAIRVALGDAEAAAAWGKRKLRPAVAEVRESLAPVLRRWGGTLQLGHYGALRGLDAWKDCDALATLGDPWPNVGDVASDAAYLGLVEHEAKGLPVEGRAEGRAEWLARVELEQAHGRIRAPHRARAGRALHVGRLRPIGAGWEGCEVRELLGGRPSEDDTVPVETLREWIQREAKGNVALAARMLGCARKSLYRYLVDGRPVPARLLPAASRSVSETAYKGDTNKGFRTHSDGTAENGGVDGGSA